MLNPDSRLFCRLDGLDASTRDQQRLLVMEELGLLEAKSVPIFEEATQTAAHFLEIPICILGLMEPDRQVFKSAVGLSRLGLMNELAHSRQFRRTESFCTHVVDSHQMLIVEDTFVYPSLASSMLTQQYGIRSYLGIPLLTSEGFCIGTLAVMDLTPRHFSSKDIEFLELLSRWTMSEFERRQTIKPQQDNPVVSPSCNEVSTSLIATQLKINLLSHLTQELRTPLTSVMGMASVLTREIYGPLTEKQKEYLAIIHNSGQYLLSLVNEIVELLNLNDSQKELTLTAVDIDMLCQQAINTLGQAAQRREQEIRLSVEPGHRIWLLDKDKIRQMLYHLVFSIIQVSNAGSIIRLHVSHRENKLHIAIWVSHPWLGDGLPYVEADSQPSLATASIMSPEAKMKGGSCIPGFEGKLLSSSFSFIAIKEDATDSAEGTDHHLSQPDNLAMLLSRQLVKMHGGQIKVQGTPESGYRYIISLPRIDQLNESL